MQDDSGWTALMAATCYDHADIVQVSMRPQSHRYYAACDCLRKELLEAGADPDIQDKQGLTAMHYAGSTAPRSNLH